MEDKILDELIELVDLLAQYTPTTPPNPLLPEIRKRVTVLKTRRQKSKSDFLKHFADVGKIIKELNSLKFNFSELGRDFKIQKFELKKVKGQKETAKDNPKPKIDKNSKPPAIKVE